MSADGARDRILARVREANQDREPIEHPGALPEGAEPPVPFGGSGRGDPVDAFEDRFRAAGGEVVKLTHETAPAWLVEFSAEFGSVALCEGVPEALLPRLPEAAPETVELGVSMAIGAAAQTGSLVLSSRDGRKPQLLPPTSLVWVREETVRATLEEALAAALKEGLPAALALHSGPSKSADIGQILVRGVHGPGRIVAAVIGRSDSPIVP